MFPDWKYHLVSLVAVFLALGTGILVGGSAVTDATFVNQQEELVSQLKIEFGELKARNQALEAQVAIMQKETLTYQQFMQEALPYLVQKRLTGKQLALVNTCGQEVPPEVFLTLELAGAKVNSLTRVDLNQGEERFLRRIGAAEAAHIFGEILQRGSSEEPLARIGGQKQSGAYGLPLDALILIMGNETKNNLQASFNAGLINHCQLNKLRVVAAEYSYLPYSQTKFAQKHGLTTIDNLETIPGQVALVLALEGETGSFGVKAGAQSLLPLINLQEKLAS